jgi:hypothetical protein
LFCFVFVPVSLYGRFKNARLLDDKGRSKVIGIRGPKKKVEEVAKVI